MSGPARFERREGIARNTAYSFGVQLVTSVFTAVLTLFLVRALEPEGYGLFALALAVSGLVAIPADLGISHSAARFVAEVRTRQAEAARVVSDALVLKLFASAATSLALFGSAGWIAAAYDEPGLTWPLRGVAVALLGHSLMSLVRATFVALARISVNFQLVLSESAVETAASIGLVLLGTGAAGAAFGRAVGYLVGAIVGVALLSRILGRGALAVHAFTPARARGMLGYAGAIAVVEGAWLAFGQVDALVVGAFLGAGAVGIYRAPMRLIIFLQYPGLAIANAVAPRLARGGDEEPARTAFVAALRYLIVFQAALIPPLLVWADPITDLVLGPGYERSADVLRALTPFVFLSGMGPLLSLTANYLGEARRRVPIAIATLIVDVALALALVPTVGVVGAAIATDIAFVLYVAGHLWICRRLLELPLRPLAVTLGRATAAGVAMAAVLAALGSSELGLGAWIAGAVVGTAAFVGMLVATREFGRTELAELRSLLVRARR